MKKLKERPIPNLAPIETATNIEEIDAFNKSDHIQAALYFMESGDYLFRWRQDKVIQQKTVTSPDVAAAFTQSEVDSGWLPSGILRHGHAAGGAWAILEIPPARREVTILNPGNSIKTLSIVFPRLIMLGMEKTYWLFAVNDLPDPGSRIAYHAPFANVYGDHHICWGNNIPPEAGISTMQNAWKMFIETPFNSDLATDKSKHYPANILVAWERYQEELRYPMTDLVLLQTPINEVVNRILRR